jgi:hypothetical protein
VPRIVSGGLTRARFAVFPCFFCVNLYPAGIDERPQPLKALVSVDRDKIREGSPFLIVIQVNHAEPLEVELVPPDFGEACTLDMMRSSMYIRSGTGDDAEKWTELELFITPNAAGKLHIDSFTISALGQSVWTQPVDLNVLPEEKGGTPNLVWGGVNSIQEGGFGEAFLRITGWSGGRQMPKDLSVNIAAPKNAIVEPLVLTGDDKHSGIVFRVRITALDNKAVILAPVKLNFEKWTLTVPALSLRVLAKSKKPSGTSSPEKDSAASLAASFLEADGQDSRGGNKKPPFPPDFAVKKSFLIALSGDSFATGSSSAEKLWDEGQFAAALAVLRKGERDSMAGNDFATLRRLCEKALGIPVLLNEKWRPPALFWSFGALALLFIIARLVVFIIARKNALFRQGFAGRLPDFPRFEIAGAVLVIIALCALPLTEKKIGSSACAIARTSNYYNVPEMTDAQAGSFDDGTPLRITASSGAWLYAASEDGAGGWIRRENLILY